MGELSRDEQKMLAIVTRAIENRRIEIYLQPVVELPKRKTVYYEVYTRLRGDGHTLILPEMFVPVAERAGLMPLIDNMMLLRAVKIIRQMDERTKARGLFCSLSTQSLVDPDFFPKLVGYLEKNADLSGRLIFEISQAQMNAAGHIEREGMRRLGRLGFRFSLDKVINLDIDYDELARRDFKFVRIGAERLINGMADLGARIHGADKASYLERYGLTLICEKIETERELATLSDYNIKFGQGFLFAEPRPVRPEVLGERAA
jgi:cyclic-di-GMP phosphodiesterase TipF (flagellum assembly factor)